MSQKQEAREDVSHRPALTTARPPPTAAPRFLEAYAFLYHPYATVHLRRPQESSERRSPLHEVANSPFKRISRVEQMISFQKTQVAAEQDHLGPPRNHSLHPHFKVRTGKHPLRNHHLTCAVDDAPSLHLQNFSLEAALRPTVVQSTPREEKAAWGNSFQETFKNRKRLNRKSPRKKMEASLLDMLNRISDGIPMQRYKSRAFENSNKATSFLP